MINQLNHSKAKDTFGLDSIREMSMTIKSNVNCFRMITPCISLKAAQMFTHAMILSHMTCCVIIWGQASQLVVEHVMSLYKNFKSYASEAITTV